jgi:hypothetical protein
MNLIKYWVQIRPALNDKTTAYTSTLSTFTPQGSVASSRAGQNQNDPASTNTFPNVVVYLKQFKNLSFVFNFKFMVKTLINKIPNLYIVQLFSISYLFASEEQDSKDIKERFKMSSFYKFDLDHPA